MIQNIVFIQHVLATLQEVLYHFLYNPEAIYRTLVPD